MKWTETDASIVEIVTGALIARIVGIARTAESVLRVMSAEIAPNVIAPLYAMIVQIVLVVCTAKTV
jgi:hypothetical protein